MSCSQHLSSISQKWRTEAAFVGALTSAMSTMLSSSTLRQLQRVGLSEKQLQTFKHSFTSISLSVEDATNNKSNLSYYNNNNNNNNFNLWLEKVNSLIFIVENTIDEHDYKINGRKNRAFKKSQWFSVDLRARHRIRKIFSLLGEIKKEARVLGLELLDLDLDWIESDTGRVDSPFPFNNKSAVNSDNNSGYSDDGFVGRTADEEKITAKLRSCSKCTIVVAGLPGIGKTMLADRVYRNDTIGIPFGKKYWVSVQGVLDETKILQEMLLQSGMPSEDKMLVSSDHVNAISSKLHEAMKKARILLVLDDVWSVKPEHYGTLLHHLESGGAKLSVVVTTRRIEISETVDASLTRELQRLSDEDSWELFKLVASRQNSIPSELETNGKQIVKRCHGVPLFIRKMATLWDLQDSKDLSSLSILALTYDCLPNSLKRCFAYCSVFPKHSIIRKSDLIRLWIAQGFVPEEATNCCIETGEKFFDILLNESLLHVYKQDEDGNVVDCIMHDLAHDLAVKSSRHEVFIFKDQRSLLSHPSEVRHLVVSSHNLKDERSVIRLGKCRTIYVTGENTLFSKVAGLETLMSQAKYMYVLKLDDIGLKEVPKNLGKLKFLRYLDLSKNPINNVPDSITQLYLLQTLLLRNCQQLKKVPDGLANLTNLSLVEISPLQLPNWSVPLTALRTPIKLDGKEDSMKMYELRDLNDIAGSLCISGLEHVEDRMAAQEARIDRKHGLSALEFQWSRERVVEAGDCHHNRDEYVLDGLQPHSNIRRIKLDNYDSQKFPTWVMRMKVEDNERLYKLVKIELVECKRCQELPTMGRLPCLQELFLVGMDNIRTIGKELYKYTDGSEENDVLEVFFPALRKLVLRNFGRLMKWLPAPTSEVMDDCQAFPRLETLHVVNCPNLTSIPTTFPSIKHLLIDGIRTKNLLHTIIIESCKNHTLTTLVLCRVPTKTLPQQLSQCTSLEELCIDDCSFLTWLPRVDGLTALNTLIIRDCGLLKEAPQKLTECISLTKLAITNCSNLQTPLNLEKLANLEELDILDCVQMKSLPGGLDALPGLRIMRVSICEDFTGFPKSKSLAKLWLKGTPATKQLPDQTTLLSHLKVMRIQSFGSLEEVPCLICDLRDLEILIFEECHKLRQFPSPGKMRQLKKLRCLRIEKCSTLERSGLEWGKIGHVPHIKFKGCWLQGDRKLLLQETPDIKAKLSSFDVEPAGLLHDSATNSDEEFYDVGSPNDSIPKRKSVCFYVMVLFLLMAAVFFFFLIKERKID